MQPRPQIHPPHRRHRRHAGRPRVAARARRPVGRRVRADGVFDISRSFATMRDLCESPDPAAAVAGAHADRIGDLAAILANTAEDKRDPNKPWLLAPIDLQAVKAAGVTFAISLLERVIEEQARGAPERAAAGARGRGKRARRRGREDQARLAAGDGTEEGAAGQGPVVAVSRSRHRAGRRDLHQVPGAWPRSAPACRSACSRPRPGTIPSPRSWSSRPRRARSSARRSATT